MALDSYANLKSAVGDWLNRADLSAVIPDFIAMAEAQLSRRLVMDGPVREMMGRAGRAAAAVAEITQFQRRKILTVMHGGGDLAELLDEIEPALCAFAREQGCDGIMGLGRKGWERVTRARGYHLAYIAMIRDLSP
jgi:hypothetical protein